MIKEKKSLKGKIPSRRKFFKAAAATGAAATPVAAAALKNLRLEGNFPFNDFFSLIIYFSSIS